MEDVDLNLLVALDALLAEGSVAKAAERLRLSASAMSRMLSRLRAATGDPLLVRAGRGLVPTPRATELRERVRQLVHDAQEVLRPAQALDLARLETIFTLRTSDGFVDNFGPALLARIVMDAPGVRLQFVQKFDRYSTGLRDGSIDLETGMISDVTGPEVRTQALFAITSSASPGAGTRSRTAGSQRPVTRRKGTLSARGGPPAGHRSTTRSQRWAWNGGLRRSSTVSRARSHWYAGPISSPPCPNGTRTTCGEGSSALPYRLWRRR